MVAKDPGYGQHSGSKFPQYVAAISVCLGSIAAGGVIGWTSNIIEELKSAKLNNIEIDDNSLGWIGSFVTLGAMTSCFPIGIMCDKLGRKLAALLLTIPFTIGWLLIIFSNSVIMLYVGRFITGFAGGAFCVAAPLYTSEISQVEIRGTLGSFFQLFLTIGVLFTFILGYFLEPLALTIVVAVIPLVFCFLFFFQPETPVFLVRQKKSHEAREVLLRLRGNEYNVDAELKEIIRFVEEAEKSKISLGESLKMRSTRVAAIVCISLMFFQQWSGINAVIFYTGDIFISAGSELDPKIATIIIGTVQVIATFVSSIVVDKLGRRMLLLISDIFMVISGILLGVFFSLQDRQLVDPETIKSLSFMPIVALCIFIVAFSVGFGPIPWMISSELFSDQIKGIATAFASTFNWFMAFLITKFYLDLKNAFGGDSTFYLYSALSILGTIFVFTVVPETKGKSVEEIQLELSGKKKVVQGIENNGFSE